MLRIAIILLVICIMFRWAFGKWPWQMIDTPAGGGSSTREMALSRARETLGVTRNASDEEIRAAHRRLIAMVHPDRGGSPDAVHEANDARDLLLAERGSLEKGEDIGD